MRLPEWGDYDQSMQREVAASMVEYRFYRDTIYRSVFTVEDSPIWIGIQELIHPPLYYLFLALPLRLFRHSDVTFQLYVVRLVSLALYLCSVWIGYRLICELVVPGHPLRWAVPGMMAFLPAYTDLMTAVNNDVGAVVLFSLFLWGAVRTILRGISFWRLVWVIGTAALCVWVKNTAALAMVLVPVTVALAWLCSVQRRWLWIGLLALGLLSASAVFSWGDAAGWYRSTMQAVSTAQKVTDAPLGARAFVVEARPDEDLRQVSQFLPTEHVGSLGGMTVTLGVWMWAAPPAQLRSPILYDGQHAAEQVLQVGVTPAFYTITTTVSADVDYLQVILRPLYSQTQQEVVVYYDGVVLVQGARDGVPSFDGARGHTGTWDGQLFVNRVRNGSAEVTGPRMRSWVDRTLSPYIRRGPSQFLTSILDWERTGWVHWWTIVRLFRSFWASFGWNHISLSRECYWGLTLLTVLGVVGALAGWMRSQPLGRSMRWKRAVGLLALVGLLVWGNAFLRPHPLAGSDPYLPVARYAYPAIIPSVLALVGGWWALMPGRARRWFLLVMFSVLSVLDVVSLLTIWTFSYAR
jgi:hypothetical protein